MAYDNDKFEPTMGSNFASADSQNYWKFIKANNLDPRKYTRTKWLEWLAIDDPVM